MNEHLNKAFGENSIFKYGSLVLISVFALFLFWKVCVFSPLPMGESDDYMMPTISLVNHGSLYITEADILQAKADFPKFYTYLNQQFTGGGFFHTESVYAHSWYMGTYSAVCIPAKMLFKELGLDQTKVFILMNALAYIGSLLYVYLFLKTSYSQRFLVIMLLVFNPALFYVTWISAEVFIFSMVVVSLVCLFNAQYKRAAFFAALASTLNVSFVIYGVAIFGVYIVESYKKSIDMNSRRHLKQFDIKETLKLILVYSIFLITPGYNYLNFKSVNLQLIYGGFVDNSDYINRYFAYLFDWNLGMFPYFSAGLILFLVLTVYAVTKRNLTAILFAVSFFGTVGIYSIIAHINCGMTSIARYNIWAIPIAIFTIVYCMDNLTFNRRSQMLIYIGLISSGILSLALLINYGPTFPNRTADNQMTPVAAYILDKIPQIYNPPLHTFYTRATGQFGYPIITEPIIYSNSNGNVRKILVNGENADRIIAVLYGNQKDLKYIQDRVAEAKKSKGYQYINLNSWSKIRINERDIISRYQYTVRNENFGKGSMFYLSSMSYNDKCKLGVEGLVLNQGGVQYGPYRKMDAGEYKIIVKGKNLENLTHDVAFNVGQQSVPISFIVNSSDEKIYSFKLNNDVEDIEIRSYNSGTREAVIISVEVQ